MTQTCPRITTRHCRQPTPSHLAIAHRSVHGTMRPPARAYCFWCFLVFCLLIMFNFAAARTMPTVNDGPSDSDGDSGHRIHPNDDSLDNLEQVKTILADIVKSNSDALLNRNYDSKIDADGTIIGDSSSSGATNEQNYYDSDPIDEYSEESEQYFEVDGSTVLLKRKPRDSSTDDPAHRVYSQTWTYESDLADRDVGVDTLEIFESNSDSSDARDPSQAGGSSHDRDTANVFKKLTISAKPLQDTNLNKLDYNSNIDSRSENELDSSYQYSMDSSNDVPASDVSLSDTPVSDPAPNTGQFREFRSGSSTIVQNDPIDANNNHLVQDNLINTNSNHLVQTRSDYSSAADSVQSSPSNVYQRQQYQSDTGAGHRREANLGASREGLLATDSNRRRHNHGLGDSARNGFRTHASGRTSGSASGDYGIAPSLNSHGSNSSPPSSGNYQQHTSQHSATTSESDSQFSVQRDDHRTPLDLNRQNLQKSRDWERLHSGFSAHIWGRNDLFAVGSSQNSRATSCPVTDGVQRVMCPTHKRGPHGRTLRVCIHTAQLCDGTIDCPNAEDEDRTGCLFYATTNLYLRKTMDILTDLSEKILLNEKAVNHRNRRRHRRKEEF